MENRPVPTVYKIRNIIHSDYKKTLENIDTLFKQRKIIATKIFKCKSVDEIKKLKQILKSYNNYIKRELNL